VAPQEYKFFYVREDGTLQLLQDWSTLNTLTSPPPGNAVNSSVPFAHRVWARSAGVFVDTPQASASTSYFYAVPPPQAPPAVVSEVSISGSHLPPQPVGRAVTLTAHAVGGTPPIEYKWHLNGAVAQGWSTSNTYVLNPSTAGTYTVLVWARGSGATADQPQASMTTVPFRFDPVPLESVISSVSLTAPTTIQSATSNTTTLRASATGGTKPYAFKFRVQYGGGAFQVLQDWSTNETFTWTTSTYGEVRVSVWARSAGNTVDAPQSSTNWTFFLFEPVRTVSLSAATASPRPPNSAVTFTAASTGGTTNFVNYQFLVQSTTQTLVGRGWGSNTTFTWTPTSPGTYTILVQAKSGVSDTSYVVTASMPFTIAP
jgi:hypothetical protein